MKTNAQIQRFGAVAAVAAAFLVIAGGATAGLRFPDNRADHSPAAIEAGQAQNIAPDDFVRRGRPSPRPAIVPVAATSSAESRFDWVDAGIGAAAVLGLSLVGAGAMLVTRTQRRRAALS